jgi:glutamate racemase
MRAAYESSKHKRSMRTPNILVFDSGLGGLTVHDEVLRLRPNANYFYAADDAAFPYGRLAEQQVIERVVAVIEHLAATFVPDIVVIACNTASTLVLPHLRTRWPEIPFVGTVPAIKPAAEKSYTRLITVLATPGTVARDYTQALIREHASHCRVELVGSEKLAGIAEDFMRGVQPDDDALIAELAPCFIQEDGAKTDEIVLACTHYPLLLPHFLRLAGSRVGWAVDFIDPAPAIARRTDHVLSEHGFLHATTVQETSGTAFFTSGATPDASLQEILGRYGLTAVRKGSLAFEPA